MSRPKLPYLVSEARAEEIRNFGRRLHALCIQFQIDLYASDAGDIIELRDLRLKLPRGYDYVATFWGCDPRGLYEHAPFSSQPKYRTSIEIERYYDAAHVPAAPRKYVGAFGTTNPKPKRATKPKGAKP